MVDRERLGLVLAASIEANAFGDCAIISDAQIADILADIAVQGFVVMPILPTEAMLSACVDNMFGSASDDWNDDARLIYFAIVQASQENPLITIPPPQVRG